MAADSTMLRSGVLATIERQQRDRANHEHEKRQQLAAHAARAHPAIQRSASDEIALTSLHVGKTCGGF